MYPPPQRVRVIHIVNHSSDAPPRFAEYTYYALVFYAMMAPMLGLSVPLLGAGMMAILAVYCVLRFGPRIRTVYTPIALPLGCGISFIVVQLLLHGEPLELVRDFVPWMLALLIVQSLSLRQGFLHRFVFAAFVIGLTTLPYLRVFGSISADSVRLGLERGITLANPNALGEWFGFCCVYFTIAGLETKRTAVRVAVWLATVGCLYVIGLTVSRASLLISVIGIIVALRRQLKRSFVPVLILIFLSGIIYELELFKPTAALYATRGMQETGRLQVWPLAIERFLSSPLIGVGVSNVSTPVPGGPGVTPHNSFLFLALASGVVPLVFYLGYWIRVAWWVFGTPVEQMSDAPFRIPLFICAFLYSLQNGLSFMSPWAIVILSMIPDAPRRLRRVKRRDTAEHGEHWGEASLNFS